LSNGVLNSYADKLEWNVLEMKIKKRFLEEKEGKSTDSQR